MIRSLVKLYLLVLAAAALAVVTINYTFYYVFHDELGATERASLSGYGFVLSQYLGQYHGAERQAALATLQQHAPESFALVSRAALPDLSATQMHDLDAGRLVIGEDNQNYYLGLPDGEVVHVQAFRPDTSRITALAYGFIALAMLCSILFWVWYHWRDLRRLEDAARKFGRGLLSTRAVLAPQSNIYGLASQFNEMAAQIEESIVRQREMMQGISHELKTPIARLAFGIALLRTPGKDAPLLQAQRLQALSKDVNELEALVSELLTFAQLDQAAAPAMPVRVNVSELIDSVAATLSEEVAERGLHLEVWSSGPHTHHACDPRLVARALLNLCRNAIRYARGRIWLQAQTSTYGVLHLTVHDDGPGIPPEERTRIFEPFYRPDSSRNRHTGGSGLGLAIVRRIALVHGGEVVLDRGPAGGARFSMSLPPMAIREMD